MPNSSDRLRDSTPTGTGNFHYLGFDFGEKRIGIAIGHKFVDSSSCSTDPTSPASPPSIASPLRAVRNINGRPEWDEITSIIHQWQPSALVVGLPLTAEGETQRLTQLAKSFGKHLRRRYQLPVHYCDERYSSNEASRIIADNRQNQNRRRAKREDSDTIAAALILEQWLNDPSREN